MPWRFKHGSRGSELYKITYIFVFKAPSLTHMRFRISHISHLNQTVKLFFKSESPGPADAGPAAPAPAGHGTETDQRLWTSVSVCEWGHPLRAMAGLRLKQAQATVNIMTRDS